MGWAVGCSQPGGHGGELPGSQLRDKPFHPLGLSFPMEEVRFTIWSCQSARDLYSLHTPVGAKAASYLMGEHP